ncbi:MAG: hypothetical protein FOGNACKC_00904 [Anaerolineae bacterium]|nr:hypothetical protein [Anaerolineae bacterium]
MSVTIRIGKTECTVTDGKWSSKDENLAKILDMLCGPKAPHGYSPNRNMGQALLAIKRFKGELVKYDEPKLKSDRDAIY